MQKHPFFAHVILFMCKNAPFLHMSFYITNKKKRVMTDNGAFLLLLLSRNRPIIKKTYNKTCILVMQRLYLYNIRILTTNHP
ncbi:Uncharacterised protein [Bacteroides heparinolyticus]|uniref:Uncharacterized protein n=1 Tax=Prevotella heparinolytica TaxID=28113 RepID=A0A449I2W9_9BACE|nr:Uncharacterised protein [Bacteroides heparinolyticus]